MVCLRDEHTIIGGLIWKHPSSSASQSKSFVTTRLAKLQGAPSELPRGQALVQRSAISLKPAITFLPMATEDTARAVYFLIAEPIITLHL